MFPNLYANPNNSRAPRVCAAVVVGLGSLAACTSSSPSVAPEAHPSYAVAVSSMPKQAEELAKATVIINTKNGSLAYTRYENVIKLVQGGGEKMFVDCGGGQGKYIVFTGTANGAAKQPGDPIFNTLPDDSKPCVGNKTNSNLDNNKVAIQALTNRIEAMGAW